MAVNFTPDLKPYSGQGKFRYWVQMVLPTIYDDSLSYMELLNKVVYVINLAIEDIDTVEENVSALLNAFNELQQFTNDYFDNLDVQEEINNKLDEMVSDGTFSEILQPLIENYQEQLNLLEARVDNLTEAITPGSTTADAELIDIRTGWQGTIYDNAGNSVRNQFEETVDLLYNLDLYDVLAPYPKTDREGSGVTMEWNGDTCHVYGNSTGTDGVNLFASTNTLPKFFKPGETYYIDFSGSNVFFQIYDYSNGNVRELLTTYNPAKFTLPSNVIGVIVRIRFFANKTIDEYVSPRILNLYNSKITEKMPTFKGVFTNFTYPNADLNTFAEVGTWTFDSTGLNNFPIVGNGIMEIIGNDKNIVEQILYYSTGLAYHRFNNPNSTPREWSPITLNKPVYYIGVKQDGDMNDFKQSGYYFVSSPNTILNKPTQNAGYCITYNYTDTLILQLWFDYIDLKLYIRANKLNVWTEWCEISGSGGTIENTYNITTSPRITTDTNYFLQAIDDETTVESSATDMTGAIMSMLTDTGYCKLGVGTFYVSGNIDLPENSKIEGCGDKTIVRLLSSVNNGYVFKTNNNTSITNLKISGSKNTITPTSGNRHGIHNVATAGETTPTTIKNPIIDNVYIENFNGSGIRCHKTGGSTDEGMLITNTIIKNCYYGINIEYYSEYHKFTNVITRNCNIACLNNGGNNVFVNCTFHGNKGFVMDSTGAITNPGHGSCVGCTFNHIGNNNGIGVHIKSLTVPFTFSACQSFYGKILIENSKGIIFNNSVFGGSPNIEVNNSTAVILSNNIFYQPPTITQSGNTNFLITNSYLSADGSPVTN